MAGEAAKVKLLCSFGGKIVPRPGDSALRYVGGHTRIVSLRRDLSFPELLQKMSEVLGGAGVVIKYQLPDEDLDSLVTVSCPDDLVNMMEELDNLSGALPDGSAKLRVFLFDPPSPLPLLLDTSDPTRRYIDALNSVPPEPSPHNSDTSTPPEPTPAPDVAPVVASPQPLYVPPQDPFSPAGYASYVSNAPQMQYFNAQQFGFFPLTPAAYHTGKPVQSLSQLPPLPSSSALQTANAGWNHVLVPAQGPRREDCGLCQKALPHAHSDSLVNDTTGGAQELNPVYHSLRLEDVANFQAKMVGGGLPDSVSEQRSEAAAVPGIGVAGPVGCYEYPRQIPRIVNDGERIAPRKVENVDHNSIVFSNDIGGFPVDLSSLYMPATTSGYSYPMVIADQLLLQQQPPPPPPPSHWPSMQHPAMQGLLMHKIAAAVSSSVNAENVHVLEPQQTPHSSVVQQVAVQDLLTNQAPAIPSAASMIRLPHGMQPSYREGGVENLHAVPVEGIVEKQQPHLPAAQHSMMHDLLSSKLPAVDLTPGAVNMVHTLQPSFREGGDENSFTHARPIEGMMEALSVNSEVHATREQHKAAPKSDASTPQAMDSESHFTVMESRDNPELVGTKELLGNAFVSTTPILPEAGSTNLMVHLPTSALDTTYANPSQYLLGSHMLFPQPPIAAGEPPIPHKRLLGAANANKVPSGDRKEQTSTAPVTNILPDVFSGNAGTLPPLPNIGKPSEINVSEVRNPLPLDSFFNTTDPWGIQQSVQAQPPKPVRVASGGSLASKDMVMENHPGPSEAHSIVVGKGSAQTPLNLISDPLSELIPPMKEVTNAQIKQGPPVVTENLATPVPAVSGTTGLSPETFNIQGAPSMAADPENKYIDDHGHEDGISKQHDRPNHGFQLSEDIERLQIIKDSDLEELSELGSGTFGTVYHGKWRGTDVAIKRISDRCFAGKPSDQERMRNDFWNEACNLADLHHPNVVAFYGVVLDGPGGSIATVTEFMVNGSLRKVLEKNDKALDMRKRLRIATDVACGMEYLHGKKIVHFDLKSDNLLVNLRDPHRPICKVGDLGLSKVKCQTLISGGVRGTLPWMAPELLSGDSNLVTDKVDVFSFGIVMWELLTGEEPYADLHYGAIIGGIVNNTLRPPVSETCDPEWRSLMEKCWSAEPSDRPTFTEVVAKLQSMAASYPRKGQPHPNPPASLTIQK